MEDSHLCHLGRSEGNLLLVAAEGCAVTLAERRPSDYNVITRCLSPVKVELVRIGNSRGIRIPKPILEQCGFKDTVELRVENDHLVMFPGRLPREGWEEAFRSAGPSTHDELLLDALPENEFDQEDWRW